MSNGDGDMQDSSLRLRWLTFDVPQLITIIGGVISIAGLYYNIDGRLSNMENRGLDRSRVIDSRFDGVERSQISAAIKLDRLPTLEQRVTTLETQLVETNKRLDRFVEVISNNMDLIRRDIGGLSTKVEVNSAITVNLNAKLDKVLEARKASSDTRSRLPASMN